MPPLSERARWGGREGKQGQGLCPWTPPEAGPLDSHTFSPSARGAIEAVRGAGMAPRAEGETDEGAGGSAPCRVPRGAPSRRDGGALAFLPSRPSYPRPSPIGGTSLVIPASTSAM